MSLKALRGAQYSNVRHELITAALERRDVMLLAERPTDGRDQLIEAVVLDDRVWPKDLDEFVSRHDGAGVLDEIQESVESLRGNFDATPVKVRQRAMLRLQAKDAELVNDGTWNRVTHLTHPADPYECVAAF